MQWKLSLFRYLLLLPLSFFERRHTGDIASRFLSIDRIQQTLNTASISPVVDGATAALYQSPEGAKVYDKWFMSTIPPKGLNLNTPMGAELKSEYAKPSDSPDPDSYKAM